MTRIRAIAVLIVAGYCVGCVSVDPANLCVDLPSAALKDVNVDDLSAIIGAPPGFFSEPQVIVKTFADDTLLASVSFRSSATSHPMPRTIDESGCGGVDWNSYSLTIDRGDWSELWTNPDANRITISIAPADSNRWIRVSRFGMLLTNGQLAESLMACGCFAQ